MRPLFNKIFVQIEKKFQDEVETESGITFYKDTSYNLEENSTTFGTVVGVPEHVDKVTVGQDFAHNVQVGDKLYFNFNVVIDEDNMIEHDGEQYWTIDYWNAIAIVRDGVVKPVGSYILIEPITEEVQSSILIIPDSAKTVERNKGIVFASNDPEIPEGSTVEYDKVGKFWNIIEGKRLYCMYNENIFFIYNSK